MILAQEELVLQPGANERSAWDRLEWEATQAFAPLAATCSAAVPLLDAYAACRLVSALQKCGLFATAGDFRRVAEVEAALRPLPATTKLLWACFDVLARQGWIEPTKDGFRAVDNIVAVPIELARAASRLAQDHPDKSGIVTVIDGTVPRLPEIIAGAVEPNQVVFPDGSMDHRHDHVADPGGAETDRRPSRIPVHRSFRCLCRPSAARARGGKSDAALRPIRY
jgi:hypothetical protein